MCNNDKYYEEPEEAQTEEEIEAEQDAIAEERESYKDE